MSQLPPIQNREDILKLLQNFYAKIRKDEKLGWIFEKHITTEEAWEHHFERLADFWGSHLMMGEKYRGNPMGVHKEVNRNIGWKLTPEDFGRWLELWLETLDEMFSGERVEMAKRKARKMSTGLFIGSYRAKNEE